MDISSLDTVLTIKKLYAAGNIRLASVYWSMLHNNILSKTVEEHHSIMSLFSDEEVFEITDYIKNQEYLKEKYSPEFIGQIIDIFEDALSENLPMRDRCINIPLHFEDEDSKGVIFADQRYDIVAEKLRQLMESWKVSMED